MNKQKTTTQTGPELIADYDKIRSTGITFVDGSWSNWTVNGTSYWISSDYWGRFVHLFSGPVDAPITDFIYNKKDFEVFTNRDEIDGQAWFTSIYKVNDNELLGFIHIERDEFDENDQYLRSGMSSIGLAYSKDNAQTFKYLGDVLTPESPETVNMQGTPYLVKDGYFYIYFNQHGNDVARAPVDEVIAAAKNGERTEWKKYYHGSWDEPGFGGKAESLNLPGICHTQAAYSTYDQKYYMSVSAMNWNGNTWIKLYQSDDCVKWNYFHTVIDEPGEKYPKASGWQYTSIVDFGDEQNATVGRKFYVLCANFDSITLKSEMFKWVVTL